MGWLLAGVVALPLTGIGLLVYVAWILDGYDAQGNPIEYSDE